MRATQPRLARAGAESPLVCKLPNGAYELRSAARALDELLRSAVSTGARIEGHACGNEASAAQARRPARQRTRRGLAGRGRIESPDAPMAVAVVTSRGRQGVLLESNLGDAPEPPPFA